MKLTLLLVAVVAMLGRHSLCFVVRHRHKKKSSKPLFEKIKKTEMLRLRQKKLFQLEKSIIRKRENNLSQSDLLSRKLIQGVHLSKQQQKGRELFLKKQNKPRQLRIKNTFVLRENQGMSIQDNIKKMKAHRKYSRHHHKFGFDNKVIGRYLEARLNKKLSFDRPRGRSLLEAKAKKEVKPESDSQLKFTKTKGSGVSGLNGGITYVERPKMTKPMYLNMSPVYDFRGY